MTSTAQTNEDLRAENERLRRRLAEAEATIRLTSNDALQLCDERLRLAVELSGIGVFDFDPQTGRQFWSQPCKDIWGFPPDVEVTPEVVLNAVHPDDRYRLRALTEGALEPHGPGEFGAEHRIVRPDGSQRWVRVRGKTVFDGSDGTRRAVRALGTMVDVTEWKRGEEALRLAHDRVGILLRSMTDGLLVLDTNWRCAFCSERGARILGREPEDIIGTSAWNLFPDSPGTTFPAEYRRAVASGRAVHFEDFYPAPLNKWLECHCYPSPEGLSVYFHDITERKRAEENLRLSTERFEITLRDSNIAVFNQNLELRYTWIHNPALGYRAEEVIGKSDAELFERPEEAATTESIKRDVIRTGASQRQEVRIHVRGTDRYYDLRVEPLRDPAGRIAGVTCAAVDITDRKQADQALRDSQKQNEFLAGLIREASQPVAIGYADGRLGLVNRAFEQLTGYTAEELRSKGWVALTPPEWHQMEWDQLAEQRRTGRPTRYEKEYLRKDGTRVPIELLVHMVPDANGNPEYYYSFVTDITPRKRAETALRASEERTRLATEATGVGIWEWNVITNEIRWDAQMFRIYGVPPTPDGLVTYSVWRDAVVPEELPRQEEALRETIERTGRGVREFRIRHPERAEVRHIQSVETVRTDGRGRVEWVVGTNLDITERKDAEAALREAERRWRTLAEAVPNLVWTCLPDGPCDWLSSQWRKYTGVPENDLLGFRWLNAVIHPDDRAHTSACWEAARADRGHYDLEYRIRRHDGVYHWFKTRGVPIRDDRGRIVYWFGTCTDIQDRKRIEQELRDADRRKDEFLATLAHELRNPLAPIRNGLEMLRLAGPQAPAFERVRTMMDRQVTQMVRLVDDLLDLSRISRGKIDLRRERVRLAAVIESAVETSRPLIEQMGHELTVALPNRPVVVDADLTRLAQVFLNLLNNAAKYTERGGRIGVTAERRGGDVVVAVRDTGIGIPADQLPHIFEMFSQVGDSLERAQGGLGIGLTLVKQLVEMHGGCVEARSPGPGHGSEFVVRLPVVEETPAAPRTSAGDEPESNPGRES